MRKVKFAFFIYFVVLVTPTTQVAAQMATQDVIGALQFPIMATNAVTTANNSIITADNMIKDLTALKDQKWDDPQDFLLSLGQAIQKGQALAYSASNIEDQYTSKYPGYNNKSATNTYSSDYQKWAQTNQDTMNGILSELNLSYQQIQNEHSLSQVLAQRSQNAQGNLQVAQVGNEILATQLSQLQQLKTILMAQSNAVATNSAYQTQKDTAQQQSIDAVVQNASQESSFPAYKDNPNLGSVPQFK